MAIVLPQGLLNNIKSEYIRRFIIEQSKILAVVGLHGNTFKPHTGTKTSVLFLQKYTKEERKKYQETSAKYETLWSDYIFKQKEKYKNVTWDSKIDETDLTPDLRQFIDTFFETSEEIESLEINLDEEIEERDNNFTRRKKSLRFLVADLQRFREATNDLELFRSTINKNGRNKRDTDKEISEIKKKTRKLERELSERTLGGQIFLVLNKQTIRNKFRKVWIENKVVNEIDYPIFFAINQKPLKDNSGEYRYRKGPNGEIEHDKHGHPIIDNDLDLIAEAFVDFAKKQGLPFWRD